MMKTWSDYTAHVTLLHSKNIDAKHKLKRETKTKQHGGRSQLWGSWLPTLWSAGTPPSPAGTVVRGSWEAQKRPRRHLGPVQTEPHGDASDQPDRSDPPCTPASGRCSQDARAHESWTHWKSAKQTFVQVHGMLVTVQANWLKMSFIINSRFFFFLNVKQKNIWLTFPMIRHDLTVSLYPIQRW